ncbi:hypothetical protein LTS18_008549, partial [Coniosporium uncinatum]
TVCHPRQHHLPPTRHEMVPRRELRHGPRPHHLRDPARFREILQRPANTPQATVHRSRPTAR